MKLRKILKKGTAVVMSLAFALTSVSLPTVIYPTNVKAETAKAAGNIPDNAEVFFDAFNEIQSFNVGTYWDVYDQYLLGNSTNKTNNLKLTSSTDGGIIDAGDDVSTEYETPAEESGTKTYTIAVQGNGGSSNSATITGVSVPKGATVSLTGPDGGFVFGTIKLGSKTYTLSKPNLGTSFTANEAGTINYYTTTGGEPWTSPDNNGGLAGFSDGAAIYLTDAPTVSNGSATISLDQAYDDIEFTLTVSWEGEADYGDATSDVGVFRIDYETGQQKTQYTNYGGSWVQEFGTNNYYSDGTYTVVGWGGSFAPGVTKEKFTFYMKSGDSTELQTILSYINICLYDANGNVLETVSGSNLTDEGTTNGYTGLSFTPNGGYDSQYIQGLKFFFNGTSEYHRGTLLLKETDVKLGDGTNSIGAYTYTDSDKYNSFYDENDASYPYLRVYQSGITGVSWGELVEGYDRDGENTGTVAGYNISLDKSWHLWTMSTSDANVVKGSVNNMAGRDALQIKYSNNDAHTTYTNLDGTVAKTGEWLVMTLRAADFDTNIKLVLKKDGEVVKSIPIVIDGNDESFVSSTKSDAVAVSASDIASEYQTVYYHLNGNGEDISFDSVSFDFSNVESSTDASKYMYVSEIYLLNPDVQISKEVKVNDGEFSKSYTSANEGDTITYQMTVTNNGGTVVENVLVEDEVPSGVTYVSGGTYTESSNKVTWNVSSLDPGASETVSFVATVDSGFNGLIHNTAKITSVNDEAKNTVSNTVTVTVVKDTPTDFVYFAEVGQKTTLSMALGTSSTTKTETTTKQQTDTYSITCDFNGNEQSSTKTISGVKLPEGATVTLTGPGGAFMFNSVTINGKYYDMHSYTVNANNEVSPTGTINYVDDLVCGFGDNSYLTFKNFGTSDNASVTIACGKLWNSAQTFTLTVSYEEEETTEVPGENTPDTFNTIPTTTDAGATIDANGIVNQNSGEILYTSTKTGADTFNITINKGSATETVPVTVYSYRVANHIYVLDYGLSVDLAKDESGTDNDNFLLKNAVLDLNIEGLDTGYSFSGIASTKRNKNSVADVDDYDTPYGIDSGEKLSKNNGEITYSYDEAEDDSLSVIYTPTKYMDSVDTFYYGVQVSKDDTTADYDSTNATPVMEGKVDVMPANIVYYEDNFSQSGTTNTDPTKGIIYAGNSVTENSTDFDETQSNSLTLQYGYDQTYTSSNTGFSGNGATQLGHTSMAAFEFTGTGFDIISRTNSVTGAFIVKVFEKTKDGVTASVNNKGTTISIQNGSKNLVTTMMIDTYYVDGDLYQIPVVSWESGETEAKDYIVMITSYGRGDTSKTIYIDGIRIYNPITSGSASNTGVGANSTGTVTGQYAEIAEDNAEIKEIRKAIFGTGFVYNAQDPLSSTFEGTPEISLIKFNADFSGGNYLSGNTVVETVDEKGGTADVNSIAEITKNMMSYAMQGPNNELYLNSQNGIGFYATETGASQKTLQIGVKVATGSTHELAYWANTNGWVKLADLSSKNENYYKIDVSKLPYTTDSSGKKKYTVIIKEGPTGSSTALDFVSLTNIKVNGYELTPLDSVAMEKNTDLKIDSFKNIYGLDEQLGSLTENTVVNYTFTTSTDVNNIKIKVGDTEIKGASVLYNDKEGIRTWTLKFKPTSSIESFDLYVFDSDDRYNVYTVTGKTATEKN